MSLGARSEKEQQLIHLRHDFCQIHQKCPQGGSNPEAAAGVKELICGGVISE